MKDKINRSLSLKAALLAFAFIVAGYIAYAPVNEAVSAQKKADPNVSPVVDPKNPNSVLYLDKAGNIAGTGDPSKKAPVTHVIALSDPSIPKDKYGNADWVKLVNSGAISPKGSLDGGEDMPPLDMDVIIKSKTPSVGDVKYPHSIHTYWFTCDNCHPAIFIPAAGTNNMNMAGIAKGEWCGKCHGKVAFELKDCARCHIPKKTEAAAPAAAPAKKKK
ncbi:MAG: hypothetical protein OEV59_01980 [Deltaproteobacteria bacterium]|nr:hypothetical protein [Deltaproteobacteria bacterium]